jgi:antitoxin (DNA-binding transcriptional repressor) of toxin-antitoxin stability system
MKGVTTAMLRDRPVARLSAALEATKPNSAAAVATRALVADDTEPRPERAREAVDFETFASFATSAKVLMEQP